MKNEADSQGLTDTGKPFSTLGCLAASPIAVGIIYLAIKLTAWLGWGVWPVPIVVVLFALILAAPIKTSSGDVSGVEKILFGLVAVASVITAVLVTTSMEYAATDLPPGDQTAAAPLSEPTPLSTPATADRTLTDETGADSQSPAVSPDTILMDYAENQIRAQKLYDRKVRVAGEVVRVREALGTGILVLKTFDPDRPLELYFTERAEPLLAEVRAGEQVTATCYLAIELAGAIALSDCRSVSLD